MAAVPTPSSPWRAALSPPPCSAISSTCCIRRTIIWSTRPAGRSATTGSITGRRAYLALHGRAAEIYDIHAFHAFQQTIVGSPLDGYHYSYPPVMLLLTAPFALIPYVPALFVWLSASWYAFYRALKLAMPGRGVLLLGARLARGADQRGGRTERLLDGGAARRRAEPASSGGPISPAPCSA